MKNTAKTIIASLVILALFTLCACADKTEAPETYVDSETLTETAAESAADGTDTEGESATGTGTGTERETESSPGSETESSPGGETESSSGAGSEKPAEDTKKGTLDTRVVTNAPETTKKTEQTEAETKPPVDPGDGHGLQTTAGGRVHVYASAPSIEYEDNSNTLPFMPLKIDTVSDPNASYNRPQVKESDIVPGLVFNGGLDYSTTYIGYDGFLFCEDTMSDYDGTSLITESRFNTLMENMKTRNDWVESVGKKMYIVIVPNKNSIYSDYMPDGYPMGSYRRMDQVVNGLREKGITVIDGRESLLAAKAANPARALYYKTDTHWNCHGAFEVYKDLMSKVKADFPNAVAHTRADYQVNYAESYMKDQTYYIGYYDATSEIGPVYTLKNGQTASFAGAQPRDKWGQYVFCYTWPNGYSDHLYYFKFRNDYNSSAPSMYMLRDSYSIALTPFLKDSFYKSTFNWSFSFGKNEILNSGADVIICEVVEKNMMTFLGQSALANW